MSSATLLTLHVGPSRWNHSAASTPSSGASARRPTSSLSHRSLTHTTSALQAEVLADTGLDAPCFPTPEARLLLLLLLLLPVCLAPLPSPALPPCTAL